MVGCSDVITGSSQRCSDHCRNSLIALTSTEEGEALMKVRAARLFFLFFFFFVVVVVVWVYFPLLLLLYSGYTFESRVTFFLCRGNEF
jgi:predicted nucleic acid-binding Zn ribbon protein